MTWVLIMTLMFQDGAYKAASASSSVSSVGGFKSEASCMRAARTWLGQVQGKEFTARAMCAQQ